MKFAYSAALLALASLLPFHAAHAAESYDACTGTINALPATVSTPGTWCLKQNLATSAGTGAAITINGSDITLDCNGFKIDGSAAGAGTIARGVKAVSRSNLTVRNCAIRGFQYGVQIAGPDGGHHLVEHNAVSGNAYAGIWVEGDGSLVRDNQVTLTGGAPNSPHAFGIYARYIVDVLDNTVSGVAPTAGLAGTGVGIYTYGNTGGTVSGNRVTGLVKTGTGPIRGIYNYQSSRVVMARNNLTGDASVGSVGASCTNATSRAKDNVISGFVTGLSACGDAGRNDITP
jgi:Right handed beta helix region